MVAAASRACVLIAILVAAAAGCGGDDADGAPPSCLPGCPASRAYDADAYHLRARFDQAAGVLHASEDVTLTALDSPIVELDAEVEIAAVHAGAQRLAFATDADAHALRVDLGPVIGAAVTAGTPVTFTVDYDAPTSDALVFAGPRDDDPVTSTVVYTDSEPDRGRRWLIGKHDPADRARFSVDVTVAAGDDVIANGERVADTTAAGARTVSYQLDPPIPTYLMAFAAGQLDHTDRTTGPVPLAVWYRRGLALDPERTLDAVADAMATFDDRLGPYPWARYAVVLLPQFGGGMENATITFNAESSGQGVVSFSLNAHELAHQWFGDQVTMRTYDDLWVKEGTATFLAAEAERARRDHAHVGRMFGSDFLFVASSAVVDPTLTGLAKYTDGPYDRAAWVITQIRRRVGEDAFWAGLRRILADHALDSVDSEGYVRAFAPLLDEPTIQQILASLRAHGLPQLNLTAVSAAGVLDLTLTLDDPDGLLIAPIELTIVDAAGAATSHAVALGTPLAVTVPAGGYIAPDERGVHPSWPRTFGAGGIAYARLSERLAPASSVPSPGMTAYLSRSPVHQERAVVGALPIPPAVNYREVYDDLDSITAQESLLSWTCNRLNQLSTTEANLLTPVVEPLLQAPALARYNTGFMRCPIDLTVRALGAELATLVAAPSAANAARLEYLLGFDHGTATNFARLTRLVTTAPSLRLRERAWSRMIAETSAGAPHRIPAGDVAAWQSAFRDGYAAVTSATRLFLVWQGSVNLADLAALPLMAPRLHTVRMSDGAQWQIVCDAHRMTRTAPDAWAQFQVDTRPWDTLYPSTAAVLADATLCDQARAAPPPPADVDDLDERARFSSFTRR